MDSANAQHDRLLGHARIDDLFFDGMDQPLPVAVLGVRQALRCAVNDGLPIHCDDLVAEVRYPDRVGGRDAKDTAGGSESVDG